MLLAVEWYSASCSCVLWNPAIADVVEEVTVPDPNHQLVSSEYLILGLGYGLRSKTYKLLLMCHKEGGSNGGTLAPATSRCSLASFSLGSDEKEPTELPAQRVGDEEESLYIDGKIYLRAR